MHPAAVRVEQDLNLDVPRPLQVALQDQPVVGEGPMRLTPSGAQRLGELGRRAHHAHALAATAGAGLDEQRVADALGLRGQGRVVLRGSVVARHDGDAVCRRLPPCGRLVAHGGDGLRRRPDPGDPRLRHRSSKRGVLGQEAVSRMDCVGAGAERHRQQLIGIEVRADLVGLIGAGRRALVGRMNADDAQSHAPRAAGHADRDLSAVGDEERGDGTVGRAGAHPPRSRATNATPEPASRRGLTPAVRQQSTAAPSAP